MLLDGLGNELTYWPITGLVEGETSEVLTFTANVPVGAKYLSASPDPRIRVWAKRTSDGAYTNISAAPYNLVGLAGNINFQVYVQVLVGISGLERIPVTVTVGTSSAAGWTS